MLTAVVNILFKGLLLLSIVIPEKLENKEANFVIGQVFSGRASYYASNLHGRKTANGETMNIHALTCAHRTLPFGTMLEVRNPATNQSTIVRVNDRGPFSGNRVFDFSIEAAKRIGMMRLGIVNVKATIVGFDGAVIIAPSDGIFAKKN